MKSLRFSPDYYCSPIWHDDGENTGEFGPIDPEDLHISSGLASDIRAWAQRFDRGLDTTDPGNSKDMDDSELRQFVDEGRKLFARLEVELGSNYVLRYGPYWNRHRVQKYLKLG
jgi:hypothetical protein